MHKIVILTKCCDDWGGSEELWARSIPMLLTAGCQITILKNKINRSHPRFVELEKWGVSLQELEVYQHDGLLKRIRKSFKEEVPPSQKEDPLHIRFTDQLRTIRPALVVVAQGINFDGLDYAQLCLSLQIPYVLISQKAVEFYWPAAAERAGMIRALTGAAACIFVSRHNQQLTEEQFGIRLPNARIIYNPVTRGSQALPYPSAEDGYRLACIGRLFILDKGQDILLRILSQKKWRERRVRVSFVGTGIDEEGIKSLAGLLQLTNVGFTGHLEDVSRIWHDHHALILPSRSEGLPLVVLEAMAAGRPVIVTTAGGSRELVEEGVTGFIGEANQESFATTMEAAWDQRDRWESMGAAAHDFIINQVPESPETEFANCLTNLLYER